MTLDASAKSSYTFSVSVSDGLLSAFRAVTVEVMEPEPPGDPPSPGRPAPPSGLEASLLTSEVVVLTWRDNGDDETGFEVHYRKNTDAWTPLRMLPADAETATVEELSGGIEYEFVVLATNRQGRTASNVASAELSLAPPTHLDAVVLSETSVRITWRDNSISETGFEVQFRPAASDSDDPAIDGEGGAAAGWREVAAVGPDATSAPLGGLAPGGSYLFRVGALGREKPGRDANAFSGAGRFTLADPRTDGELTDCAPGETVATLSGDYEVRMCFETPSGAQVDASNYHLESSASGLLYFFDRDNVEVLAKVLDGCSINGHRWVFVAPVTTLAFNLEIVERSTGNTFTHRNAKGVVAATASDVAAFPCDPEPSAAATSSAEGPQAGASRRMPARTPAYPVSAARTPVAESPPVCEPEGPGIELESGHRVDMCFELPDGEIGQALDWGLARRSSALVYFFDRENVEVLVKVLDGCGVNGHHWVFTGAVTDLAFQLVVTSPDGQRWTHANTGGRIAETRSDTAAFQCR